jgi:tetratricopeptide (TPR) repeat protein
MGWAPRYDLEPYAMLADVAAQQRDAAALRRYVPLAEATARRYGHALYAAIAHRACGVENMLAGNWEAAEMYLEQALAMFQEADTPWQLGGTYVELGHLAAARGNQELARAHYACALEFFEALQAAPDAQRTRQALAALDGGSSANSLTAQGTANDVMSSRLLHSKGPGLDTTLS